MALLLVKSLAVSLGLTLVLELPFAFIAGKRRKDLVLVGLVNILTNPAVVLLYFLAAALTPIPPVVTKAVLEIGAVLVEALYYKRYGEHFRRPFLFSLGVNAFSFSIGEIISFIGG